MALVRTPRSSWIEEGLRALGDGGPEAVRIEPLARALGVSKGGFYWHFEDRKSLLEEMLDAWERTWVDEVAEAIEAEGGDARSRLRQLFAIASAAGAELFKVELAIRNWARHDKAVAKRLRQVDDRRVDYMRALFGEFCEDDGEVGVAKDPVRDGVQTVADDHAEARERPFVPSLRPHDQLAGVHAAPSCAPGQPGRISVYKGTGTAQFTQSGYSKEAR